MSNNAPFQSIVGLNNMSSQFDSEPSQSQNGGSTFGDVDPELQLFTNPSFWDWDAGEAVTDAATSRMANEGNVNYSTADFPFPDYSNPAFPPAPSTNTSPTTAAFAPSSTRRTRTYSTTSTNPHRVLPAQQLPASATSPTSTSSPNPGAVGTKRKLPPSSDSATPLALDDDDDDDDDNVRITAEEDKRRRNTAASARFRVKKKQREQAMEKTAKEMTDRVSELEGRVNDLEKENKLLKGLLTEKNGSGAGGERAKVKVEGKGEGR